MENVLEALAESTRACEFLPRSEKALLKNAEALAGSQLCETATDKQGMLPTVSPYNEDAMKLQVITDVKVSCAEMRLKWRKRRFIMRSKARLKLITNIRVICVDNGKERKGEKPFVLL